MQTLPIIDKPLSIDRISYLDRCVRLWIARKFARDRSWNGHHQLRATAGTCVGELIARTNENDRANDKLSKSMDNCIFLLSITRYADTATSTVQEIEQFFEILRQFLG